MEDNPAVRETGKIIEGKKGFADTDVHFAGGEWLVANIEEGSMSLSCARLPADVPRMLPAKAPVTAGHCVSGTA
jgi:hypothetical protein